MSKPVHRLQSSQGSISRQQDSDCGGWRVEEEEGIGGKTVMEKIQYK